MKLPSKELLSEVLGLKINLVEIDEARNKVFYYCNQFGRITGEINIYELVHKCKEWAFDKGFVLKSYKKQGAFSGTYHYAIDINDKICEWLANTEYEAIFKACEWIMEQTK